MVDGQRDAADRAAPGRGLLAAMAAGAFVLGALCYANTLHGEFVFDDIKLIVNNDIVKDPSRVRDVLFTNLWGLLGRGSNYYRPLPPLIFMLLHALFGMRPEPFHLVNIVLHAGTSTLVFVAGRALLLQSGTAPARAAWSALAGAAVFATHPVHSEAVAWVSGVMDVSCTFSSVLAITLHVTRRGARWPALRTGLSMTALLLALFSKEPAVVVPFVLVAYDLLFCRTEVRSAAGAVRRWAPAFAVLVAYLGLRGYALGGVAPFVREEKGTTLELVLTFPRLIALYLQKLVLPVGLNVVHDIERVSSVTSPAFLLSLLTLAVAGLVAWGVARTGRGARFGLLLFAAALAPSLYLPGLSQDVAKAFAERYLYFPSVGATLALSATLAAVGRGDAARFRAAIAGVAAIAVVFSGLTVARNTVWRDSLALWSDCVQKSPKLALAHESLGLALIRRGKAEEGRVRLRAALALSPELPQIAMDSGVRAAGTGLLLQAILSFQTALLYDPGFVEAHYNQALAFEQLGWKEAAIQEYLATLGQAPDHADAHNNLGVLLAEQQRVDQALAHFEAAVRSRPTDPELRLNLARAYEVTGRTGEAAEELALAAIARSQGATAGTRRAPSP